MISYHFRERHDLTRKYIYVLIDAFGKSEQNIQFLRRSVELLIGLIKQSPEDVLFEDSLVPPKRPRLVRVVQNRQKGVDSLKPFDWEGASISSCVKYLLMKGCQVHQNEKVYQEAIEQLISSANLQLLPQILPDHETLIAM